jgi:hypothetical protein
VTLEAPEEESSVMKLYKATTANGTLIKDGTVDPTAGDLLIEIDAVPCDDAAMERAMRRLAGDEDPEHYRLIVEQVFEAASDSAASAL